MSPTVARTLFIHVGPVKTGTSAVQDLLRQHDNTALIYPKVGLWGPGSHHGLVYSFFGETMRGKKPFADPKKLFGEIAAAVNKVERNVLVSSEMFGPPPGSKKKRDLVAFVDALLQYLEGDWTVEVLVTCRDHFERAASAYSQRIKGQESLECDGPDEYLFRHIDGLQYAPFIHALRQFGYKITALNYHPARNWTTRFMTYVGIPPSDIPSSQSKNVSLSVKALIAKLSANRTLQTDDERHRFLRLLKRMPGFYASSQFIFGSDVVAAAERQFSKDREFLRGEFDRELPSPDPSERENMFFLDPGDLEEIGVVARKLGTSGNAVVDAARQYLRPAQ
jgi:hypothetical protein